jgi:hypothetical protein
MSADQRPRTLGTVILLSYYIAFYLSVDERIGPLPAGILLVASFVFLWMAPAQPLPVHMNRSLAQRRIGVVLTFVGWLVLCGDYEVTIVAPGLLPRLYGYLICYTGAAIFLVGVLLMDWRSIGLGSVWLGRTARMNERDAQLRLRAFAASGRILISAVVIISTLVWWSHVHQLGRSQSLAPGVFLGLGVVVMLLPSAIVAWTERELPPSDRHPEPLGNPDHRPSGAA